VEVVAKSNTQVMVIFSLRTGRSLVFWYMSDSYAKDINNNYKKKKKTLIMIR